MLRMQVSCSSCKCAYFPVICMVRCFVRMQGRCVFLVCMSVFVSYAGSFFFFSSSWTFFFWMPFFLYAGAFLFRMQGCFVFVCNMCFLLSCVGGFVFVCSSVCFSYA